MFDIGTMELLVIAVMAIVVVGPKELPRLLRGVAQVMRTVRSLTSEFRMGVESLAAEVEREVDPFKDLKEEEGITPGMSAEEITEKIMSNRAEAEPKPAGPAETSERAEAAAEPNADGAAGQSSAAGKEA